MEAGSVVRKVLAACPENHGSFTTKDGASAGVSS
jgi:hypothetical protein